MKSDRNIEDTDTHVKVTLRFSEIEECGRGHSDTPVTLENRRFSGLGTDLQEIEF